MPRQSRKPSGTGIYHVMMRGINHQTIFEDEEDNYQFINTLDRMRVRYDDEGNACGWNCCYYAYCLMGNHFHLLIRERDERVGETIKRIVLRYIHQNPVKAGIVVKVKDYEFSSWGEYDGTVEPVFQICDVNTVLNRITFKELDKWVNDPLDDDVFCLDNDNERPCLRLSDDQVWQDIIKYVGVGNSSDFQKLEKGKQRETLRTLLDIGASIRQLQRLTGLGRGIIQRV